MDTKDYLAYKAKGNVTLERVMREERDDKGDPVVVPDADAVKIIPQVFDKFGNESAGQPVEYSISGLRADRANHVDEIARIDQLLADLESV